MKVKIANKELKATLDASLLLGSIQLDGAVTLALIKNRKKLVKAHADFVEAHEAVLSSRCLKDESNKPLLRFQKDEAGNDLETLPKQYVFETGAQEAATVSELKTLAEMEAELDLENVSEEALKTIPKITPEQMDILMLIAPLAE